MRPPGTASHPGMWAQRCWSQFPAWIILCLFLLFVFGDTISYASPDSLVPPEQEPHRSTVFVIDVSTSMHDIVDDLRVALKEYIRESRPGHSISIVTFGTTSRLLYRKTIRSDADIDKLLKFCDELSCDDESTYLPSGLNAGVNELYQFYQKHPAGIHDLVLMTDGLNNPPRDLDEDEQITYDAIRGKHFSNFKPGREWYISYVALKGIPDVELKDFVEACRGNTIVLERTGAWTPGTTAAQIRRQRRLSFAISVAEIRPGTSIFLNGNNVMHLGGAVMPIKIRIPLMIRPRKGNPHGKRLKIEPILNDAMEGVRLLVEVWPKEIECNSKPRMEEITLSIDGIWDGAIAGALLFRPIDKSIFIVHPTQFQFQFKKPPRLLLGRYNPALDQGEYDPIDWLALGPMEPGEKCSKKIAIKLDGSYSGDEIEIEAIPDINLPEGITCSADVYLEGLLSKRAYVEIVAEAKDDAVFDERMQYTGKLHLISPSRSISFSQASVPLKVFTSGSESEASWRKRDHDYTAEVNYDWKAIGLFVALPLLILSLLAAVGFVRFRTYMSKFIPADGWLVVLERPSEADMQNIDLKQLSESLKKSELTIGSDSSSQIRLPHDSVSQEHARLRTSREGTPAPVYLAPLGLSDVKVNNTLIDEEVKLQDRDIIEIGGFQLMYSNSHLKQIVVHYQDGDVKYGIPLTWNIEEDGFVMRPEGEASDMLQAYIPFRELKAVFFVKDFDKEIARKMKFSAISTRKDHIIVQFKDGEKIEGYTMRDYDEKAPRFFMVPKTDPEKEENNICILVERKFAKSIKLLKEHA